MDQPWSLARTLRELLTIVVDFVDALRQPVLVAAMALIVVLVIARFAVGLH